MTTTSEPVTWPRTLYRGTDHEWTLRRVDAGGVPLIPTSAQAQIRGTYGGPLWVECDIAIDPSAGWVTVTIPKAATAGPEWDTRSQGIWDLEVVLSGLTYRWVMGVVEVSPDVTRDAP